MIESSVISWLCFLGIVGISTLSGLVLSSCMPWKDSALAAHCSWAAGLILAPLLAGFSAVLALLVLPQSQSSYHIMFVVVFLSLIVLSCYPKINRKNLEIVCYRLTFDSGTFLMIVFLSLWLLALAINTTFLPLMQNDALEYATVGRLLFENKTLSIYPVLNPANSSGFYGPWTHPPLYVALIYLASAIQGHAHAPGLMRLIAPWFLVSATIGVIALGALQRLRLGLLSGLLFISTPLLFLGADSALIDALPTSGIVLLMLVMVGLTRPQGSNQLAKFQTRLQGVKLGAWLGLALGLSLWTHSQAILYIPLLAVGLFLLRGLLRWQQVFVEWTSALVVALIIAGLPYYNNVMIFGLPISDNPVIFALRELDWQGYFRFARGLDTWQSIIQYGIFKGWFSLEAYALDFWLMTLGLFALFRKYSWKQFIHMLRSGLDEYPLGMSVLLFSAGWILTYLSGVVLSVLLGVDLMIRNERYMLVIIPAVVLCGGFGVLQFASGLKIYDENQKRTRRTLKSIWFYVVGILVLTMQFVEVAWYYRWNNISDHVVQAVFSREEKSFATSRLDRILSNFPAFNVIQKLSSITPDDALVLSMRPADMYYSDRKMLSYLDPRMLPIYRASLPELAAKELKALGVHYLHLVDYFLPPLYNSTIQKILSKPELSKLEYSNGSNYQIYSLQDSGLREGVSYDITPGVVVWTKMTTIKFGSRKNLMRLSFNPQMITSNIKSISNFPFFHRDYGIILTTEVGKLPSSLANKGHTFKLDPKAEYLIQLELEGRGFIRVWMTQYDENHHIISQDTLGTREPARIGELSLTEKYPDRLFVRRFKPLSAAKFLEIGVESMGKSYIKIKRATYVKLVPRTT